MTTREQGAIAERFARRFGSSTVLPLDQSSAVLVAGTPEDGGEPSYVYVPPAGRGARKATDREIRHALQRARVLEAEAQRRAR